MSKRNTQNW